MNNSKRFKEFFVVGEGDVFTALSVGTRVTSEGARGLALDGVFVQAGDKSETVALDGSNVIGGAGSTTFVYQGACGRFQRNASVHLYEGVKGYARNGCTVVSLGGHIWNTGDDSVLPGNEPAGVVGEAGAILYVHVGARVITEPNVIGGN
ncbi:MAG: hypothetical protein WC028_09990 [Candidatus Obscuribacterales bacterium]|jgi:hypothetical protein